MPIFGRVSKKILSSFLILGIITTQINTLSLRVSAADSDSGQTYAVPNNTIGQNYYVSNDGNDEASGTSPETAWKSLEKVNEKTFNPGDQILFRRGDKWENKTLYPKGSGSDGKPIKIASYGDTQEPLPAIAANAQVNDAVYLYNQEYWEISELDVSNTSAGYTGTRNETNGALLKDLRGIHITGRDVATLSGINLHNLYVHDVTGYDAWIGGLEDTNTTSWKEPGIIMNTGWDFSKRTGGILIEALKPTGNTPTIFKNITLADSTLLRNSFGAFTIKQWSGGSSGPKWAKRSTSATAPAYNDSNFKPHENITVKGNYIDQTGDYNANGIYVTSSKNVLVENNVVKNPGVCGIELYFVDYATVQNNEVYGSRAKAGGADSNGIDPDREVTNTIIQYNYVHDNGDGILVCGFAYNSVIIRYNLLKDNTGIWFRDSVDNGLIEIYNNVCYNTLDRSYIAFANSNGGGGKNEIWKYRNNIFYNISDKVTSVSFGSDDATHNSFDNNVYYGSGVSAPSRDINAILADPMFTEAAPSYGSGDSVENRVRDFSALMPKAGSPLINSAKPYVKNASAISINTNELDYQGKTLSAIPEIGLFESQFNGTLSGYVTNEYGEKVSNAQVKLGDKEVVTTNANGYYVIPSITMGTYSITVSKDGYESKTESVQVTAETDGFNLSIGKFTNDSIDVNGIVKDSNGSTIEGAKVTISKAGNEVATARSGVGGVYSLKNVPIGTGYTITVSKDGYYDGLQLDVKVFAEQSSVTEVRVKSGITKRALISDDFNNYEVGSFTSSSGSLWNTYSSNANNVIEVVADPDDSNNKLLHLKRSGGNLSIYNKWEANIAGIFTINTRVKRTTGGGQYGIYTFHKSGFNSTTPTSSTNPEATLAMVSGKINSHNVRGSSTTVTADNYTNNVWYNVTHVVDWGTGTYDLYVDGKLKLRNQPLRTWSTSIDLDYLQIFSTDADNGDFYVDYIDVYQGFPYSDKLSSIEVSGVDLTVDEEDKNLYTGTVDSTVDSVTVTGNRAADFPSRIFVNGVQAATGEESQAIALQSGENTISIDLKDNSNNVLRSYTLKLTKEVPPVSKDELQTLYDANKDKEKGNYTDESWAVFTEALDKAEDVLTKTDATQAEVDAAKDELETTISSLVEKVETDKSQLEELYEANKDKTNNGYTEVSWTSFTEAKAKAKEVIDNEAATQSEVNEAINKLTLALAQLEYVVDKETLISTIEIAQNKLKNEEEFTPSSVKILKDSIKKAEEVVNKQEVTQEEVNNALKELLEALTKLTARADNENLANLINTAESILEYKDKYTSASWEVFMNNLSNAKLVRENGDAAENEIKKAYDDLGASIVNLVFRANKTSLETVLDVANQVFENIEKYMPATIEGLQAVVEEAQSIMDKDDATQEEVNRVTKVLVNAVSKATLKAKKENLINTVNLVRKLNLNRYTNESVYPLSILMSGVQGILEDENVEQGTVDELDNEIKLAVAELVEKLSEVNKENLNEKINEIEGLNEPDYTEESWSVLKEALAAAKEVLNSSNTTQEFIDKAYEDLAKAEDDLKKKDSNVTPDSDTETDSKDNDKSSQGDLPQTGRTSASVWLGLSSLLIILGAIFLKKSKRLKV